MSGTDRFPEMTRCQAAAKAVDDFDTNHETKRLALIAVGHALENGDGWSAVKFREHTPISGEGLRPDIEPVSLNALQGESIEEIVLTRGRLMEEWRNALAAVPEPIRSSAKRPSRW
jgi:hypothetical protein